MEDRMADSEMMGDIEANGFDLGCQAVEDKLIPYIEGVRDWLKNLAEDRTLPMDVKVHKLLWDKIQSIDHDIETKFNEVSGNSLHK